MRSGTSEERQFLFHCYSQAHYCDTNISKWDIFHYRFPAVIVKFLALRNCALRHNELQVSEKTTGYCWRTYAGQHRLCQTGAPPMEDAAPPSRPVPEEVAALRRPMADLTAAQEVAQQIVETIRDPLLVLTPDFRVQVANPAFYQLFHVSRRRRKVSTSISWAMGNGISRSCGPCWKRFCPGIRSSTTMW